MVLVFFLCFWIFNSRANDCQRRSPQDALLIHYEKFLMRTLPCLLILASLMFLIQIINSNPMTYAVANQDRYWSVLSGVHKYHLSIQALLATLVSSFQIT